MDYYVSKKVGSDEAGTEEQPFLTIGKASVVAEPGDTIWIGEGVYREWVRPRKGGTDETHRIIYTNIPGEKAVISGAEEIKNWIFCGDNVWKATISEMIEEEYNPYSVEIFGDWYDSLGQVHHTGEIFIDDIALYEVPNMEYAKQINMSKRQDCWCAAVSGNKTEIWVYLLDLDPNEHKMEASIRPYCFFPEEEGRNYITVSGLVLEKAATQWAPPTAFQAGVIGTHWSKGWVIKDCIISNSKCSGISLGKKHEIKDNIWSINPYKNGTQTYTEIIFSNLKEGWSKENIGSHVIRDNEIYACGQAGIVGCMGGAFSVIEGNHIHDINNREEFGGAEVAGIKLHGAIDVLLENNIVHDCTRGLWLDWEAQGTRVTRNAFFNNHEEDIFIEVCHGPCTIDNNLLLSDCSLRNMSQGTAFVHNLFAGSTKVFRELDRFTMYHFPHDTFVSGLMVIYGGDDKICGNVYVGKKMEECCGNAVYNGYLDVHAEQDVNKSGHPKPYQDYTLPVSIHDNIYFNGARKYECERGAEEERDFEVNLQIMRSGNQYYLETNLSEYKFDAKLAIVTTEMLGKSYAAEAMYENADGSPFALERDFGGLIRSEKNIVGPFVSPLSRIFLG